MRPEILYDTLVIGAGPSGMTASIYAAGEGRNVLLLDRLDTIGKKILVTGNGRCNITNLSQKPEYYRTNAPAKAWSIFLKYDEKKVLGLMEMLGIVTKDRDGYVYPYNDQAACVRDAFEDYLHSLPGLTVKTGHTVTDIKWKKKRKLYAVTCEDHSGFSTYLARNVIVATGGFAGKNMGCKGDGYRFAGSMGLHVISPMPALTALCSSAPFLKKLSGVRCRASISILADGEVIARETGELQWTDYGISGVAVFSLSRFAIRAMEEMKEIRALLDLVPDYTGEELVSLLLRIRNDCGYKDNLSLLNGLLPKKLSPVLLKEAALDTHCPVREDNEEDIRRLARVLKSFVLKIRGYKSYDKAQVTMGGVSLSELSDDLEALAYPGLFFAGEVLDVDGTCGGYNLQWAFSSGRTAGTAAAARVTTGKPERKY